MRRRAVDAVGDRGALLVGERDELRGVQVTVGRRKGMSMIVAALLIVGDMTTGAPVFLPSVLTQTGARTHSPASIARVHNVSQVTLQAGGALR